MTEEDGKNTGTSNVDVDSNNSSQVSSTPLPLEQEQQEKNQIEEDEDEEASLMKPLMLNPTDEFDTISIRSRNRKVVQSQQKEDDAPQHQQNRRLLRRSPNERRYTLVMNFFARILFWASILALVAIVVWYSYELKNNGKDPHLIAWFSAGAFVLLGFPISMYGIVMHLANYNQPNVQIYIIRILWMVPIYSIESWLCLRYRQYAIYIETLRDFYESYVLYSFLQYLIQVLGGEEELILMLKDKSPTRGVHMWGLQYCVRPWLMGQPVSRSVIAPATSSKISPFSQKPSSANNNAGNTNSGQSNNLSTGNNNNTATTSSATTSATSIASGGKNATGGKRVQWTSPFYVRCKFGVLQYVLSKFVISFCVMILELNGIYKEGDFTPKGGYLYICILTNISQCWALYCLIFFYYATVTELSPFRPVGKFLSVKAVVFFTWWQSVCISMIYQANFIREYHGEGQDENIWTPEDVAKGMQDYLICIEMFVASLVHVFVFPHTDYLPQAVQARSAQQLSTYTQQYAARRVGRLHNPVSAYGWLYTSHHQNKDFDDRSKNSNSASGGAQYNVNNGATEEQDYALELPSVEESNHHNKNTDSSASTAPNGMEIQQQTQSAVAKSKPASTSTQHDQSTTILETSSKQHSREEGYTEEQSQPKTGFLSAFIDATLNTAIPRDILENSAGIIKGDYVVEKKTLLHHATTSDTYDLFSSSTAPSNSHKRHLTPPKPRKTPKQQQ